MSAPAAQRGERRREPEPARRATHEQRRGAGGPVSVVGDVASPAGASRKGRQPLAGEVRKAVPGDDDVREVSGSLGPDAADGEFGRRRGRWPGVAHEAHPGVVGLEPTGAKAFVQVWRVGERRHGVHVRGGAEERVGTVEDVVVGGGGDAQRQRAVEHAAGQRARGDARDAVEFEDLDAVLGGERPRCGAIEVDDRGALRGLETSAG